MCQLLLEFMNEKDPHGTLEGDTCCGDFLNEHRLRVPIEGYNFKECAKSRVHGNDYIEQRTDQSEDRKAHNMGYPESTQPHNMTNRGI